MREVEEDEDNCPCEKDVRLETGESWLDPRGEWRVSETVAG